MNNLNLSNKKILGIKIHMLHVLKNTRLEKYYEETKFHLLTKEEYVDIVCNQIEELNLYKKSLIFEYITGKKVVSYE